MRDHKPKNKPVFGGNFCDYPQKVKYIYPFERIFFAYDSLFFFADCTKKFTEISLFALRGK